MVASTADLIARAKPRTLEVPVCSAGDLVDAHDKLTSDLARFRAGGDSGSLAGGAEPKITDLAQQIVDLEAEMAEATVIYRVQSIGRKAWADLKALHPPTPAERKQGLDINMATFPQAAIAACAVEPTVSPAEAEQLTVVLPEGEWGKLWSAVCGVNMGVLDTPKSAAAAVILRASAS